MATVRTRRNASSESYSPGFYRALNNSGTVTSADLSSRDSPQSLTISDANELPSNCFLVDRVIAKRRCKVSTIILYMNLLIRKFNIPNYRESTSI